MIGAYSMRPIHVKFLIELLLFIAASSLWLRRLEAWLFAWRMRWMSEQGFFGAQKNVYGTGMNYVRSKQVNYPCINAFSRDHMFSYSSVDADATHSKE